MALTTLLLCYALTSSRLIVDVMMYEDGNDIDPLLAVLPYLVWLVGACSTLVFVVPVGERLSALLPTLQFLLTGAVLYYGLTFITWHAPRLTRSSSMILLASLMVVLAKAICTHICLMAALRLPHANREMVSILTTMIQSLVIAYGHLVGFAAMGMSTLIVVEVILTISEVQRNVTLMRGETEVERLIRWLRLCARFCSRCCFRGSVAQVWPVTPSEEVEAGGEVAVPCAWQAHAAQATLPEQPSLKQQVLTESVAASNISELASLAIITATLCAGRFNIEGGSGHSHTGQILVYAAIIFVFEFVSDLLTAAYCSRLSCRGWGRYCNYTASAFSVSWQVQFALCVTASLAALSACVVLLQTTCFDKDADGRLQSRGAC